MSTHHTEQVSVQLPPFLEQLGLCLRFMTIYIRHLEQQHLRLTAEVKTQAEYIGLRSAVITRIEYQLTICVASLCNSV